MDELEIVRHPQIEGLSVFLNTVDYRTPHLHSEWEVIWVLENPLLVTCGQNRWQVEPGQMILFNPNEPHECSKTEGSCTFACLQVSPKLLPVHPRLHADAHFPHEYLSSGEMEALRRQFRELMRDYLHREDQYALSCVGSCCLLFHRLLSRMPNRILTVEEAANMDRRNTRLKRLIRFVDENYMHKLRLSDFAAAEGYSMSYLSHFIKGAMNQSFQEYVLSVRLNCACRLMAAGGKRMLDICMESGFSDYRYFSRAFQKQFAMTPEEYSRSHREEKSLPGAHRSIHSVERFYTREDSLRLLSQLEPKPPSPPQ